MGPDRGFGQLENQYKVTAKLHEPQDFFNAASKLTNADVKRLYAEDMLDLKELAFEHFQHNKAKNCLFSKCKRVFLTITHPHFMVLEYYDKDVKKFEMESVYLADQHSVIAKLQLKTAKEFQSYYLQHSGKSEDEIQELLPTLKTNKFVTILPKKFQEGQVMTISDVKLKDIAVLQILTHPKAKKWIRGVIARQKEPNIRARTHQAQQKADDKIYFHDDNVEDERDLPTDTECATKLDEDLFPMTSISKKKKSKGRKKTLKKRDSEGIKASGSKAKPKKGIKQSKRKQSKGKELESSESGNI